VGVSLNSSKTKKPGANRDSFDDDLTLSSYRPVELDCKLTMADFHSEFWRKLAAEFRSVSCFGMSITWTTFSDTGKSEIGFHSDVSDRGRSVKAQFDAICTEAGLRLKADSDNPILLWLDVLKQDSPNDMPGEGHNQGPDGALHKTITGRINNPCLASANLCSTIQMHAKKAEAASQQKTVKLNPPKDEKHSHEIQFPRRAAFLQDCLTERNWDRNTLEAHNGPDHKTTKRILDGKKVHERSLRKLAIALSTHPKAKQVRFRDIPTD